jgi:hypothetical protein
MSATVRMPSHAPTCSETAPEQLPWASPNTTPSLQLEPTPAISGKAQRGRCRTTFATDTGLGNRKRHQALDEVLGGTKVVSSAVPYLKGAVSLELPLKLLSIG